MIVDPRRVFCRLPRLVAIHSFLLSLHSFGYVILDRDIRLDITRMRFEFVLSLFLATTTTAGTLRQWSSFETTQSLGHEPTREVVAEETTGDIWQNPPRIANFETEGPLDGLPQTPNAKFKRTRYGPITLKPHSHSDEYIMSVPRPCDNCWVTAFQTEVVFKDNTKATQEQGVQLRVS
jgi:hypothetical protein